MPHSLPNHDEPGPKSVKALLNDRAGCMEIKYIGIVSLQYFILTTVIFNS